MAQVLLPISVSLAADQTTIGPGGSTVLRWSIVGIEFIPADSITLSPIPGGGDNNLITWDGPVFGNAYNVSPSTTTTYTITVKRSSDGAIATATVTVTVLFSLILTPSNGPCGNYSLSWAVGFPPNIQTVIIDQGIGAVSPNGSLPVTVLSGSKTWTITVVNSTGTYTATATLSMAVYVGGTTGPTISPQTFAVDPALPAPSYWNGGASVLAGLYYFEYADGWFTYVTGPPIYYAAWGSQKIFEAGAYTGIQFPPPTGPAPGGGYFDSASTVAGCTGLFQAFCHGGGSLGLQIYDTSYSNNTDGSPNVSFRLTGPAPIVTLTASPSTIYAGNSSTLTWTGNSTSASINQGVGAVGASGSLAVSPLVTTTYTLTANTDGFSPVTANTTVTVIQIPPPVNVNAAGQCGGRIVLSWAMPSGIPYTGFQVWRSADGTTFAQIAAPSGLTYLDTPPASWVTYYYRVVAVNNAAASPSSSLTAAYPLDVPSAPTGLTVTAAPGMLIIAGMSAAHTNLYTLYGSPIAGDPNPPIVVSGLLSPYYVMGRLIETTETLYFLMTATNQCGESLKSTEVSGSPLYIDACDWSSEGVIASPWQDADGCSTPWESGSVSSSGFSSGPTGQTNWNK
jgi:hypothetical protein